MTHNHVPLTTHTRNMNLREARSHAHLPTPAHSLPLQVLAAQATYLKSRRMEDAWRCPCCREICNCSSEKCQRRLRHLEFTRILSHETHHLGYKSVRWQVAGGARGQKGPGD